MITAITIAIIATMISLFLFGFDVRTSGDCEETASNDVRAACSGIKDDSSGDTDKAAAGSTGGEENPIVGGSVSTG
jgi:hypothetical protein